MLSQELGAVIGLIIGWFGNLIYMREKFISKADCDKCNKSLIERLERIDKRSLETYGMVKEMHGFIKSETGGEL